MKQKGLVAWAKDHLRESEIAHLDERIAELEDELARLRARRQDLWRKT